MQSGFARPIAAALCVIVITPAVAQRTGTRLDRNQGAVGSVSKLDAKSAIKATHAFGQCIAFREEKRTRRALEQPLVSPEQVKLLNGARDTFDDCLGTSDQFDQIAYSQVLLAGSAAEYFVRTTQQKMDLGPLAGMTDEALAGTAFKPRNGLEDLGMCIVRRNPTKARAFVMSRPAEADEAAAFRALLPDVGPCIFQGETMKMNAPNVRAITAYALYRAGTKMGTPGA
jgi:hypothetical protein